MNIYKKNSQISFDSVETTSFSWIGLLGKLIMGFVIGVGIGNIIALVFSYINGGFLPTTPAFAEEQSTLLDAALKSNLAYGIFGVVSSTSAYLYEIAPEEYEASKLFKATAFHLAINIATFFIIGYYLKWFTDGIWVTLSAVLIFLATYALIWIIIYFSTRQSVLAINKQLENKKNRQA